MENLISVIVPIYNSEKYLSRCINSIINQTYYNLEIILVNDGSNDNTLKICNTYKKKDNRVIVVDKINEGVSIARNEGIQIANGEFISFIDSDDYINKNMYEILIKIIKKNKTEVCAMIPHSIRTPSRLLENSEYIDNNVAFKELLLLKFPTSLWAYLYSKTALKNLYLSTEVNFFEDFEFNCRVIKKNSSISLCHENLYNYELNDESVNNSVINMDRMTCLKIYDIVFDEIKNIKEASFFRAHFLISIILSLSKSKRNESKYYEISKISANEMLKDIIFSKYVPMTYKIIISLYCVSPLFVIKTIGKFKYS